MSHAVDIDGVFVPKPPEALVRHEVQQVAILQVTATTTTAYAPPDVPTQLEAPPPLPLPPPPPLQLQQEGDEDDSESGPHRPSLEDAAHALLSCLASPKGSHAQLSAEAAAAADHLLLQYASAESLPLEPEGPADAMHALRNPSSSSSSSSAPASTLASSGGTGRPAGSAGAAPSGSPLPPLLESAGAGGGTAGSSRRASPSSSPSTPPPDTPPSREPSLQHSRRGSAEKDMVDNLHRLSEAPQRTLTLDDCFGATLVTDAGSVRHTVAARVVGSSSGGPCRRRPVKRKARKGSKRSKEQALMLDLEKAAEEQEQRLERLSRIERLEKERVLEKRAERAKEKALREHLIKSKLHMDDNHLRLLRRADDFQSQEEVQLSERLKERRQAHDKLSSKNPEWRTELQQHAMHLTKEQQESRARHTKELRHLLKEQHNMTPTYMYSPTLDKSKREEAERRKEEEAKRDAPYMHQLRKQKYGAFVSEMFAPTTQRPMHGGVSGAAEGTMLPPLRTFAHHQNEHLSPVPPSCLNREERNKEGLRNLRNMQHSKRVRRPSHASSKAHVLPPDVKTRLQGDQNMREASLCIRQPCPPSEMPLSPTEARMRLINIAKKNIARKGWNDTALISLAEKGIVNGTATKRALDELHSNSDALLQAIDAKMDLLRSSP